MTWVIAAVVVVALGVAAVAATGGFGEMPESPVRDVYRQQLPEAPLTATDIETLRFGVTLRGYAMGQVDHVLDRLRGEIADRDTEIADLRRRLDPVAVSTGPTAGVLSATGPVDADPADGA
ncbi:MAG: DivIVA domain-containing protein [Propionibacteriaceae bacterium]